MVTTSILKRNCRIFFRNKTNVFFSLMSVLITLALNVLFLKNNISSSYQGLATSPDLFMADWLISGILCIASITTTLGALGVMVNDSDKKINKDFYSSPISRSSLLSGYISSTFTVGCVMSLCLILFSQAYVLSAGGSLWSVETYIKLLGACFISVLSGSAMMFLLIIFIKTASAYSSASTVVGTLIGFITGAYIPLGVLPDAVQSVVKFFPTSYSALLFRKILCEDSAAALFNGFPAEALQETRETMGLTFNVGSITITPVICVAVLIATTAICYGVALMLMRRKKLS